MERLPQSVCACASLISHPVTLPNEGGVGRLLFLDIASVFVVVAQTFFPISLFCGYKCDYICPYVSSTYRNIHYCCLVLSMRINILIWFNNLVLMTVSAPFSSFLPSFLPFVPAHVLTLSPPSLPFFLHSLTTLIPQTSAGQTVVIFKDCSVSPGDRFFQLHLSS